MVCYAAKSRATRCAICYSGRAAFPRGEASAGRNVLVIHNGAPMWLSFNEECDFRDHLSNEKDELRANSAYGARQATGFRLHSQPPGPT
jgi:hypothetical protein